MHDSALLRDIARLREVQLACATAVSREAFAEAERCAMKARAAQEESADIVGFWHALVSNRHALGCDLLRLAGERVIVAQAECDAACEIAAIASEAFAAAEAGRVAARAHQEAADAMYGNAVRTERHRRDEAVLAGLADAHLSRRLA